MQIDLNMEPAIVEVSGRYNIPVALVRAIVQVESQGNTWAVKYEPTFVQAYLLGRRWEVFSPWITQDTEVWQRGASWGLMQVMGQVAREHGFVGAYISELCLPETGLHYGCKYLAYQFGRWYKVHGIRGVVSSYNAGSPAAHNSGYVLKVEQNIPGGFDALDCDLRAWA